MEEVRQTVGVRATCGIGTNLYLAKVALDITAKHSPDFIGVLDEESYRRTMWEHRPITDFWRVGPGIAKTLKRHGVDTMGAITRLPEDYLYDWFGVDAELLIDHAWGREPTTIADIKAYRSKTNCLTSGQVLMRDYGFEEGELIVREMMDQLCLEMADKGVVTKSVTLHVGYSNALRIESARGSASVSAETNATRMWLPAVSALYRRIVNASYPIRRIDLTCNHVVSEREAREQLSIFDTPRETEKSRVLQSALLDIKKKYGKNAIVKGMSLEESATGRERNRQIGGHKSGEK